MIYADHCSRGDDVVPHSSQTPLAGEIATLRRGHFCVNNLGLNIHTTIYRKASRSGFERIAPAFVAVVVESPIRSVAFSEQLRRDFCIFILKTGT
jgi:hypothetical protein